jgi:hypothetical protein
MPSIVGSDRPASFDDATESEEGNLSRPRPASRVSSYIGLRVNTPPIHDLDTFPHFREPDNVYHNPSVFAMAEMIKVAIMGQGTFLPLPVEYNSCILHVLEAYQGMHMEIAKRGEEIEAMKRRHTETIKDFEDMATKWELREKDYQTELKNLEVLLSRTEGGMEKVSLARTRSAVHGSRRIRESVRDLKSIKQRDIELTKGKFPDMFLVHILNIPGSFISTNDASHPLYIQQEEGQVFRQKKRSGKPTGQSPSDARTTSDHHEIPARNQILNPPVREATRASFQQPLENFIGSRPSNPSLRGTQEHLVGLKSERLWLDDTSGSESDSSDSSDGFAGPEIRVPDQDLQNPLSEASSPLQKLRRGVGERGEREKTFMRHSDIVPSQMSFSFNTGDDLSILGERFSIHGNKKTPTPITMRSASEQNSQTNLATESEKKPQRRRSAIPKLVQEHVKNSISTESSFQDDRVLNRFNSTSSVLTAFRAGSGRNSSKDSRSNSLGGHKHGAERKSSSSEAVTVAVRAVKRRNLSDQQHTSELTVNSQRRPSPSQRSEQK